MKKKDIKNYFNAIVSGNINIVASLIDTDKEYLTVCNVAPPKKDDGQSGLQAALLSGNFSVAKLLIERGADVNFMDASDVNAWQMPVLNDSIRAAIFCSYTLQKNTRVFDEAFEVMQLMLSKGANANGIDSYGNNALLRGILDARQMINNTRATLEDGILLSQLRRIFKALLDAGAAPGSKNNKRDSANHFITAFSLQQYNLW